MIILIFTTLFRIILNNYKLLIFFKINLKMLDQTEFQNTKTLSLITYTIEPKIF